MLFLFTIFIVSTVIKKNKLYQIEQFNILFIYVKNVIINVILNVNGKNIAKQHYIKREKEKRKIIM